MGEDPEPDVDVARRLSDPGQRLARIAEKTRQERRPEPVRRQFEHAVNRIHPGRKPLRRDLRLDPSPSRCRSQTFAKSDERRGNDHSRSKGGDKVATTVYSPSHSANPPTDKRFGRVVGPSD